LIKSAGNAITIGDRTHKARGSADITFLASPVTGGGITVNRFQQLFLLALSQGKKQPAHKKQMLN